MFGISVGFKRFSFVALIKKALAIRGGSRTAATSKIERFVIIVNGFQPLTIITKRSILDVAAVLDPPLAMILYNIWLKTPSCSNRGFPCFIINSRNFYVLD